LRVFRSLPSLDGILLNPGTAPVPDEPSALCAVATGLARRATDQNFAAISDYAGRLACEYGTLLVKSATARVPDLAHHPAFNRRPRALAHADRLAGAVRLDMAAAGWRPTVDTYLGRVTKSRILQAVREAEGEPAAQLIDHLKTPEMAKEAERLLGSTGWLPEALRVANPEVATSEPGGAAEALPDFLAAEEGDEAEAADPEEPQEFGIAAE
jgi:hypothetical protein